MTTTGNPDGAAPALDHAVIDIHMHTSPAPAIAIQAMGGSAPAGFTGTHAELVPFMAQTGIEKAVLLNFTPVADMALAARSRWPGDLAPALRQEREEELRQDLANRVKRRNTWSCEEAKTNPNLLPFIGIDPVLDAEAMEQEVEERARQGVRGIKLHPTVQRVFVNDRRFWPAYAAAQRLGMIVLTHMGPFGDLSGEYAHPALFAEVAAAFPNLRAVLAHCGGEDGFAAAIALAREYPNVMFDCCAVTVGPRSIGNLDDEGLSNLFRRLGPDRVAFGSDWCFRDPRPDIACILRLPLSKDEKRMILHDNAARWLGLDG